MFTEDERTEKEMRYVQAMHRGCLELFREFLSLAGKVESESLGLSFSDCLLGISEEILVSDPDSVLYQLSLVDDWNGQRNPI